MPSASTAHGGESGVPQLLAEGEFQIIHGLVNVKRVKRVKPETHSTHLAVLTPYSRLSLHPIQNAKKRIRVAEIGEHANRALGG
jgi:hypothetical protein